MSHQGYHHLSAKDVVFVEGIESSASLFKTDATLRIKDLLDKVKTICAESNQLSAEEVDILFGEGINCEILRPGATDWQSGSLQMNLGFQAKENGGGTAPATPSATPISIPQTNRNNPPAAPAAPPVAMPAQTAPKAAAAPTTASAEPVIELEIENFTNATNSSVLESNQSLGIDHEDVFSLMENTSAEEIGERFSFEEGFGDIEALEIDNKPTESTDPIASPWDLEELDSMLMAK
ncbi:hypothetical protein IQ266_17075 [filamentous cyanobacterium LEGE 11480]|uniref:Uncharacterized protein n=1 Tax=Romeriopsis navalis LEGE 11480 TaxID=2777977 RepID=A0A928VST8_9CYAN|nr:KGK domain-containing protein [Romeriopsis navalis]MBE9031449.1 hypothetical protein [Romeriopsis navalis LEGE 11480]